MSTFGRGLRYEMKKISGTTVGSGFTDLISIPASSNYFIFVNYFKDDSGRPLRTVLEDGNINGSESGFSGAWLAYHDFGNGNDPTRLVSPGGSLNIGLGSSYTIYYTEVYFGGQSNY